MGTPSKGPCNVHVLYFCIAIVLCSNVLQCCMADESYRGSTPRLFVNASEASGHRIPDTLFGIFFEEINHAGAGGLWAELVSNRGFEAGGPNTPSNIDPWSIIGNKTLLDVSTDRSSCFERNKVALRMEVLCGGEAKNMCPAEGVGVYNPGYWGMNIEQGKGYRAIMYVRSSGLINLVLSLTSSDGSRTLATSRIMASASKVSKWTKVEVVLIAKDTDSNARLQLTATKKGVIWLDQVSLMPLDTHKGHGFRKDLYDMVADLKPRFIRFPGGCYVEGEWLRNAVRWKESIGPWEERPGHFGDVWKYWTDDGLGYYEFLQLAEDLGTVPVWVVNNGISHQDEVDTSNVLPFVQEALDSIEFARGDAKSKWGSIRAKMGHPEPFNLTYIAVGNEDCGKKNYKGNYLKFYDAIKHAYPDMRIISNCDGTSQTLDHPADLFDFHVYTSASSLFYMNNKFDNQARIGPKVFASEYAVYGNDAGNGTLLAALGEAAFLIGLERNSDVIDMASYAPLFVNQNDRQWTPDAIVFNSSHHYGTPSYYMQHFFRDSSGATVLKTRTDASFSGYLTASAIARKNPVDGSKYISIKVVNFGADALNLSISVDGLESNSIQLNGSTKTVLTSSDVKDENSFQEPKKIVPVQTPLPNAGKNMNVELLPYSFTSFDLLRK